MNNPTVCFTAKGKVELLDKPTLPLKTGQMLVQTIATQISIGTEMSILMKENVDENSVWDTYGTYPFDAGYTNVGIVIDIGDGVDKSWLGKTVASYGVHAKYVVVSPSTSYLVPEGIKPEEALFFVTSEITMNGIRKARVSWGDVVVIYGSGNIGQFTARYCEMAGAQYVFVVDISDERLAMLPQNDTIIPINSKTQNVKEIVLNKNDGLKPDIVFEATGFAGIIPEEAALVRNNGKLIILSSPRGKTSFDFHDLCNASSIKIIGAHNCSHPMNEEEENPWTKARDAKFFFSLLMRGKLDIKNLTTHRVSSIEAESIYEMLKKDRSYAGGIMIKWTKAEDISLRK